MVSTRPAAVAKRRAKAQRYQERYRESARKDSSGWLTVSAYEYVM